MLPDQIGNLQIGLITVLPELFDSLHYGITGRAIKQGLVKLDCWDLREWGIGPHRQVDDKPYGGGPGMVLMYEPLDAAIRHAKSVLPNTCRTIYLSPQGRSLKQAELTKRAKSKQALLFVCGRYEGIDQRIIDQYVDDEWSIGDFVVSGGELAAMLFIDAMIRQLPGSLGHPASADQDSFADNLLDYPHYTRPEDINGLSVPDVLLSGNHQKIAQWRRKQALGATWLRRPDLLNEYELTELDKKLLVEFKSGGIGNEYN